MQGIRNAGVSAGRAAATSGARRGRTFVTKAQGIAKGPVAVARSRSAAAATTTHARGLASIPDMNSSWVDSRSDPKDTARKAIVYELLQNSNMVAESLVPWFTDNMPATYFRQVRRRGTRATRKCHLMFRCGHPQTLCSALPSYMISSTFRTST